MQRSKRILVVSHCILNQNTVIPHEARALGAVPSVLQWVGKEGFGLVQLPCPEFTFLGLDRPPMTYEEYNTEEYRKHCRSIVTPVIEQLVAYQESGYELCGLVGIGSSPSCDPLRGIFMEEFQELQRKNGIIIKDTWFLPDVSDPIFDSNTHRIQN
ncbi:CD3072 family TudS-related putative desulfidase [Robertmurraya korlensis]|uniref:CD3072 family TudS-related putative desulfidase n=1 Tax=Robertmurraya korlensis TaxID=519977 RepID=UPI0008263EDF|nr:CD3072 family TudS-related putative desulfidase [Robertmurraya korlensis]